MAFSQYGHPDVPSARSLKNHKEQPVGVLTSLDFCYFATLSLPEKEKDKILKI